ncbi:MAG: histidine phosphatase family protein [Cellulomonas sp.]|jgi:broad specificity phosphatase PhoE|nr:histidine phosphatase family protein [Cellulomonas sp.]
MVMTMVHLLRHGEVHNPEGVLYGRLPGYRLSELGEQMAQAVADDLVGQASEPRHDIAVVVASPLERAQQTAAPLAAAFGLDVGVDDRLIEAGNHFEGLRFGVGEGSLVNPRHWPHLRNPMRPSWGEPYVEQVIRMRAAVETVRRAVPGREAVLVSHQLPIWVTRLAAEGRRLWHDPRRRQCTLASLTTLRFDGDRLVGVGYREPAAPLLAQAATTPGA